jgi:rod shape determining protein RodA
LTDSLLKKINYSLAALPLLIFTLGYVTHLSTSESRATNHLLFFLVGYGMFWLISFVDYRLYQNLYRKIYISVMAMLGLIFVIGEATHGSVRWLSIGAVSFQPSELAKFALVLFVAFYITENYAVLRKPHELLKLALYVLPMVLLVFIQPDLGSSIILMVVFIAMLYIAGLNWIYFFLGFCLLALLSRPVWHLLHDYQKQRILVFLNPTLDTQGKGYNVIQSLISIGSGGLTGKGFGHGTQTHLNFLPIYWTDFVFAGFAEEWGFVGVVMLLLLFGLLFIALMLTMIRATDQLGSIIVAGVLSVIFVQFAINVGMNMELLPVTGIPLPYVSYGGTSLIASSMLLGIAHSVWLYRRT